MRRFLILSLLLVISAASAEAVVYQIKASYIYNFLQFVQFSGDKLPGQLNVCIIGDNKFGSALDALDGAATPEGKIKIHLIGNHQQAAALTSCQVMYIVGSDADFSRQVLADVDTAQVLTIGEFPEFIAMGGFIELFLANDSVHFRINKKLAGNTQFKVAAQLLSLGVSDS